ncbi:MAG: hypothetical protein WCY86_12090, partial [Spirosomataceae bacterium]
VHANPDFAYLRNYNITPTGFWATVGEQSFFYRNGTPTGFGFGVVIREIVLIWEWRRGNFKG